jgi:uncharacterized membrane protein YqgA involved in biofilm formation
LYAGWRCGAAGILASMDHWTFVLAAYALVFGVLLTYWCRIESGIRMFERAAETRPTSERR